MKKTNAQWKRRKHQQQHNNTKQDLQ
jgi:hypothetical protein